MPKPPVLPVIDWRAVFEAAAPFDVWIAGGEAPDNRRAILAALETQPLAAEQESALRSLPRPVSVVAFAEDWCGDVVRHVPVLERLARAGGRLQARYLARVERPDVFVRFLTNGGEAVPKFVFLNERFVECGHWGPMPAACRELIARGKACGDVPAARRRVAELYAADPRKHQVVRELLDLAALAAAERP